MENKNLKDVIAETISRRQPSAEAARVLAKWLSAPPPKATEEKSIYAQWAEVARRYTEAMEPFFKLYFVTIELERRAKVTTDIEEYERIERELDKANDWLKKNKSVVQSFLQLTRAFFEGRERVFGALAAQVEAQAKLVDRVEDELTDIGLDLTILEFDAGIPAKAASDA